MALHLPLPVIALALPIAATFERLQSQALGETIHLPFITAASARGVSREAVVLRHAWPVSLKSICAVYGIVMPSLTAMFPSAGIARALRNVVCVGPKAAAAGFHEPSLVFMAGTHTLLTDASGAADFLSQGSCRFALIESRHERQFAQRAERTGLRYAVVTRFEGYNYSQGRPIAMTIFRSEGTE